MQPAQKTFGTFLAATLISACATTSVAAQAHQAIRAPAEQSGSWCKRLMPGAASRDGVELSLSKAHAVRRFFGVNAKYSEVDQVLARVLEFRSMHQRVDLGLYASSLPETCTHAAATVKAGRLTQTEIKDEVAWVKPGLTIPDLPGQLRAIVLDLRDYPNAPEARSLLKQTISAIVKGSLTLPARSARHHLGMTDEHFFPVSVYTNAIQTVDGVTIEGARYEATPLFVLVGKQISPDAAEFAGALRLARKAHLVGEDLPSSIAESVWFGVDQEGLAFRIHDLHSEQQRWPDVIRADMTIDEMSRRLIQAGAALTAVPEPVTASNDRPSFQSATPYKDIQAAKYGRGDLRAALLVAHGALRLFFPNFDDLGDRIDSRLLYLLEKVDATTGDLALGERRKFLRSLSASLRDGHSFVFAQPKDPDVKGYLPLVLETIGGRPVVRRSGVDGILPGDTIVEIDGRDVREIYREELALSSSSSPGYRYDIATRELIRLKQPIDLKIRGLGNNAKIRTLRVDPVPFESLLPLQPSTPIIRKSGWLSDLGESKTYFLNLSEESVNSVEVFKTLLAEASSAEHLILDVRGFPRIDLYEVAQRLICTQAGSPVLKIPVLSSPFDRDFVVRTRELVPLAGPNYCGPLTLLIGPHTVSSAEQLSMMFVDAKRVRVFGEDSSAGANGNVTGIQLPGSLVLTFTGMKVLHADGSTYIGRGIRPDVVVPLTAEDLATGHDTTLLRASAD